MILSQGLPQMKTTASLLSVVHADPSPAPATSSSIFNSNTNNDASTINMLGQGIIACSNRIGSLKQLLSNVAAVSNVPNSTS